MRKGQRLSEEQRDKFKNLNKGVCRSVEQKKRMSEKRRGRFCGEESPCFGKKRSIEWRQAQSGRLKGRFCGKNNSHYVDGRTPLYRKIRNSFEYRKWRGEVFERDGYTCQISGLKEGVVLCAHHIENFGGNLELRFVRKNGITWNLGHHKVFHILYGYGSNTLGQVQEFMEYICQMN